MYDMTPALARQQQEDQLQDTDIAGNASNALEDALHVYITGFGPFAGVPTNPSWLAVKPLHGCSFKRKDGRSVQMHTEEIQVEYHEVLSKIPVRHGIGQSSSNQGSSNRTYSLFIHVGVSPSRKHISIEQRARRYGYNREDFAGQPCRSAIDKDSRKQRYGFVDTDWDVDEDGELPTTIDSRSVIKAMKTYG